uniref:Uncharacterized protein n=1 Tax=Xenopus tropicalis TaxID=8364 RepID=A0A803K2Z1_XENTR
WAKGAQPEGQLGGGFGVSAYLCPGYPWNYSGVTVTPMFLYICNLVMGEKHIPGGAQKGSPPGMDPDGIWHLSSSLKRVHWTLVSQLHDSLAMEKKTK